MNLNPKECSLELTTKPLQPDYSGCEAIHSLVYSARKAPPDQKMEVNVNKRRRLISIVSSIGRVTRSALFPSTCCQKRSPRIQTNDTCLESMNISFRQQPQLEAKRERFTRIFLFYGSLMIVSERMLTKHFFQI